MNEQSWLKHINGSFICPFCQPLPVYALMYGTVCLGFGCDRAPTIGYKSDITMARGELAEGVYAVF